MQRSAGFTLIELMVALVLLGLIFLVITSGLQFGIKASDEKRSHNSGVLAAQQLLRRVVNEARPLWIESTPTARRHVFFDGSEDSLRFIAPMPEHLGVGGFYEVAVQVTRADDSGSRVELSWHLFREAGRHPPEQRVVLLNEVAKVQFAYFGPRGQNEPARWYDDWRDLGSLPDLILMRVVFSEEDQVWPDLVVATKVRSVFMINTEL